MLCWASKLSLLLLVLSSCSEQQIFDNTFKFTQQQLYSNNCESKNKTCILEANLQFDECYNQIDLDTIKLLEQSKESDWSNPIEVMNTPYGLQIMKFTEQFSACLYKKGFSSTIKETSIKITQPTAYDKNSKSALIAIKDNGTIYFNKHKTDLKSFKELATEYINKHQSVNVVIIADKRSSTATLITVMDLLKASGYSKISMASSR